VQLKNSHLPKIGFVLRAQQPPQQKKKKEKKKKSCF